MNAKRIIFWIVALAIFGGIYYFKTRDRGAAKANARAVQLLGSGRNEEALKLLQPLANQHPKNPEILYNLSNAYMATEKYDQAVATAKRVLALKPQHQGAADVIREANAALAPPPSPDESTKGDLQDVQKAFR